VKRLNAYGYSFRDSGQSESQVEKWKRTTSLFICKFPIYSAFFEKCVNGRIKTTSPTNGWNSTTAQRKKEKFTGFVKTPLKNDGHHTGMTCRHVSIHVAVAPGLPVEILRAQCAKWLMLTGGELCTRSCCLWRCSGVWEKAGETINEQPQGTVNGLVEGNEYQFRVIAVNKSGQSEPSRPCANFIAKPRYCEYKSNTIHITILSRRVVIMTAGYSIVEPNEIGLVKHSK